MARLTTSEPKCAQRADREDAHDVDLQRDHRAGGEAHGEIEREPPAPDR